MTQRTSAETFEEYLPGKLIREHRAQSSRDVFVQILARRHVQENVIIPAVPEPLLLFKNQPRWSISMSTIMARP